MSLNPVNTPSEKKGGKGGLWGKIAGGLVGAIGGALAPFTGGASAAGGIAAGAALSGAAAGAGLGGTAGELIGAAADPLKISEGKGVNLLETVAKTDPMVQLGLLSKAQNDLRTDTRFSPDEAKEVHGYLDTARAKLNERMNLGRRSWR